MKKELNKFDFANIAKSDEFDLLDPKALDEILGGLSCKKDYKDNNGSISCGCGYKNGGISSGPITKT